MEELLSNVHQKMNQEMSLTHSSFEDAIHNWLSDQSENQSLMEAILVEGKSIKDAAAYATNQARKNAVNGVAAITDAQVFQWVVDYFLGQETKITKTKGLKKVSSSVEVEDEDDSETYAKVDKKTTKTIEAVLEMVMEDADKINLIKQMISVDMKDTNKKETIEPVVKVEDVTMSIFDFGLSEEDEDEKECCES